MYIDKTKIIYYMQESPRSIAANGFIIKVVQEYIYLGQTLQLD